MKKRLKIIPLSLALLVPLVFALTRGSAPAASGNVDVDLSALSSTMVYAQLFNILTDSESYLGKTIKMQGSYYASRSEITDRLYHLVIVNDTSACCEAGIEFIWSGEHTYPDDYPAENARIEVAGIFDSYQMSGQTLYYLAVDDISILQ